MTVSGIRDKMDLHAEYYIPAGHRSPEFTLRIYVTRRAGIYGYQFASIIWWGNFSYASNKTGGCGYCKENNCAAEAMQAFDDFRAKLGHGKVLPKKSDGSRWMDWHSYTDGNGPQAAIEAYFGAKPHRAQG
jgi:hypothetical protein